MNTSRNRRPRRSAQRRRGAALVLAVALMFALFGFLAFSIDTGYLAQSKAEMRRSADAAALAGCWELYGQMDKGVHAPASHAAIRTVAANMAALNPICKQQPQVDASELSQDITIGYLNDLRDSNINNDSSRPFYAVKVEVKRTADTNGEIPFFFGRIFGQTGRPMTSEATAVMAKQISGFSTPTSGGPNINLLPFALDQTTWDGLMAATQSGSGGVDDYAFDPETGEVTAGQDGIFEVNLYPQGTGSPGNRGTVDIGGANNSTNDIARQILYGISEQDLQDLGKDLVMDPSTETMTLNGDTGISAGVKDELASIIGEKRIIPIFSSVSGNGNNANYTIVRWCGVRIIDVKLTGKMSGKKLIIQPAAVLASCGMVTTTATHSSDYVLSPVLLAR